MTVGEAVAETVVRQEQTTEWWRDQLPVGVTPDMARAAAGKGLDPRAIRPLHEGAAEDLLDQIVLTFPPPFGLGRKLKTLTTWRCRGFGPPPTLVGATPYYKRGTVLAWINAREVRSARQGRLVNRREVKAGLAAKAATGTEG